MEFVKIVKQNNIVKNVQQQVINVLNVLKDIIQMEQNVLIVNQRIVKNVIQLQVHVQVV